MSERAKKRQTERKRRLAGEVGHRAQKTSGANHTRAEEDGSAGLPGSAASTPVRLALRTERHPGSGRGLSPGTKPRSPA